MELVKTTLSEQIYELLKQEIFDHKIKLGDKLTNRGLQKRFNVSSTPIRDAINRLNQEGLVVDITNVGAQVVSLECSKIIEITETLSLLCVGAIKLVSETPNRLDIVEKLVHIIDLQQENMRNENYYKYDYDFHRIFFEFLNNSTCLELYEKYHVAQVLYIKSFDGIFDTQEKAIEQHHNILSAYINGDISLAQDYMKQNFDIAIDFIKKIYA